MTVNSKKFLGQCLVVLCLAVGIYHMAANWYGLLQPLFHTSMHLSAMILIAFLVSREGKDDLAVFQALNLVLGLIAASAFIYSAIYHIEIQERGLFPNMADKVFALVAIAAVLETTRRYYGLALPIIALVVLTYAFLGGYMPSGWGHSAWDWDFLTYTIFMGSDGIFGVAAKVSATLIFTFVMLGAFLERVGATERIIGFATELTAPFSGGPAKVAILASGLMGTISGSAVANVAATGRFTIPMMISGGFRPKFAAGVEAVASTGGLLMPPIMGAGAFVMAEILGISYWKIAAAAIVPALLFYLVVFLSVHFEARRLGLDGQTREVGVLKSVATAAPFLLPIVVLIGFISMDVSPIRAALYTIVFVVGLAVFIVRPLTPSALIDALVQGTREAVPIACACACAGIIIGVLTGTGFAIKFSSMLVSMSDGIPLLTLFLSMVVVIFLGMALPATASYLVGAAVVAVPLIKLGYPPLAVHLFVFYFANLAHITPPVDLATYAGASIAKANPLEASFSALKIGLIAFLLPYAFISQPVLLLIDFEWLSFVTAFLTAVGGAFILGAGITGWFQWPLPGWARVVTVAGGISLIQPDIRIGLVGLGLSIMAWLLSRWHVSNRSTEERRASRGDLPGS